MTNPIPLNGMFVTPNSLADLAEMIDQIGTPEEQRMTLDRSWVEDASLKWTWAECWHIFEENLIDCSVV